MNVFTPADIMIPKGIDFEKWSVVACDQYTSQRDYWEDAARLVGSAPSTLKITFPEVYLNDGGAEERIEKINNTMEEYLAADMFCTLKNSFVYVEREQSNGKVRRGLIGKIDLEEYDFSKGSGSKVRATEGTILSRIPPRQKIRRNAPLELPHILMLIDDREATVIEPIGEIKQSFEKLYDFELMKDGGHITGYLVDQKLNQSITDAINRLEDRNSFNEKYNVKDEPVLLIAAGDGNHSLATAKTCWEEVKKNLSEEERKTHPARYALVELNNIHDPALEFEPIQRVIFKTEPKKLMDALFEYYPGASKKDNGGQRIAYTYGKSEGMIYIKDAPSNLPVGTLQEFLDKYLSENSGELDYIHGNDVVRQLASEENTIGFMVEPMEKNDLFTTVIKDGALPRKTFSMGEARDKRFYLECKRIK
ncbi:MAG: DUF1015 domain-containing protein [Clostridiales bacterium]|nr:DUF1015 domain-containing protein [Clostridiales bacterium]